jgi:hypothetical protein
MHCTIESSGLAIVDCTCIVAPHRAPIFGHLQHMYEARIPQAMTIQLMGAARPKRQKIQVFAVVSEILLPQPYISGLAMTGVPFLSLDRPSFSIFQSWRWSRYVHSGRHLIALASISLSTPSSYTHTHRKRLKPA